MQGAVVVRRDVAVGGKCCVLLGEGRFADVLEVGQSLAPAAKSPESSCVAPAASLRFSHSSLRRAENCQSHQSLEFLPASPLS